MSFPSLSSSFSLPPHHLLSSLSQSGQLLVTVKPHQPTVVQWRLLQALRHSTFNSCGRDRRISLGPQEPHPTPVHRLRGKLLASPPLPHPQTPSPAQPSQAPATRPAECPGQAARVKVLLIHEPHKVKVRLDLDERILEADDGDGVRRASELSNEGWKDGLPPAKGSPRRLLCLPDLDPIPSLTAAPTHKLRHLQNHHRHQQHVPPDVRGKLPEHLHIELLLIHEPHKVKACLDLDECILEADDGDGMQRAGELCNRRQRGHRAASFACWI